MFVGFDSVTSMIRGKSIAIVGSAPSCLENERGFIDSHDVVIRVNNHKIGEAQGSRTDIHYSFYGSSIRKTPGELKREGVKLCMCKCPNSQPIESQWHVANGKKNGIDFRYIYELRKNWWFCDAWIPSDEEFVNSFNLLGGHIPTTGFSAILDVLRAEPKSIYLTGFDFFSSGIHNVNEPWKKGNQNDPICHDPKAEAKWLSENINSYPIKLDKKLSEMIGVK